MLKPHESINSYYWKKKRSVKISSIRIIATMLAVSVFASLLTGCRDNTYGEFKPPEYVFVPEVSSIGELSGGLQNINNLHIAVLLSDAFHLFGIDAETGETVVVLNWIDSDVSSAGVNDISIMQDDRIILVRQNWDWAGGFVTELVLLTKTVYADLPQKTLLTLATFESDSHRESVLEFNRGSTTHRIQIIYRF